MKDWQQNIVEAEEIIADGSDAEMVEMAKMELDEAKEKLPEIGGNNQVLADSQEPGGCEKRGQ